MPRIRRTPEAARAHIIEAAKRLLIEEGPRALKLQRVGKAAGMSHASVIHYFGSIEGLASAVLMDNHRTRRETLRSDLMTAESRVERAQGIDHALQSLSDREQGRLTLSLLSLGLDPFPPAEELGLASIAELLNAVTDTPLDEAKQVVLANVLVMVGEAMVGEHMRARLGLGDSEEDRTAFRRWMLERLR